MKKFLLILLTLSMLLTAIPFSVSAEDDIRDAFYDSLPPWDNYSNYIDYENEDGHKTEGYRPGKITVFMTEEFMSTHEAPTPADFVDYRNNIFFDENIVDIIHKDYYDYNEFDIILDVFQEPYPVPVEQSINYYIFSLDDMLHIRNEERQKIVEKVRANYVSEKVSFLEEWVVYDEYYYYKNEDNHKREGYITDAILVRVTDTFESFVFNNYSKSADGYYYLEASLFPEFQDKIKSFYLGTLGNMAHIELESRGEEVKDYTEEHIDAHVELLKYLCEHPIVASVTPNRMMVGYIDPPIITPIDPPDSETDETTTDTEAVTTEPEETTLPETTAPETTKDESENTALNNHQTGDELYFLMAAAVLSFAAIAFVTTLKRRVKSK